MIERYAIRVVTQPPYEPLSLAEAKAHLRIDDDITKWDALVTSYIKAARNWCEAFTGRALVQQTLEMSLDTYPSAGVFELPRTPIVSVDSIKYVDNNGVEQTWAAAQYQTDLSSEPARIALAYGGTLPSSIRGDLNEWRVRFTAGYPVGSPNDQAGYTENIPDMLKLAMKVHITGSFENMLDRLVKTAETIAWPLRASFL